MTGNAKGRQHRGMRGIIVASAMSLLFLAPASAQTQFSDQSLDGLWLSDGYGELFDIHGVDLRTYEVTKVSCIAAGRADRKGSVSTDNEFIFAGEGDTFRISQGTSAGTLWLHDDGGVSNILLRRTGSRPDPCRQPLANTPLTNYQVFWETFAENYPFFAMRQMNWPATDKKFRPQVTPKTTPEQLFRILSNTIAPLHDAHTNIRAISINQRFSGYRPAADPMRRRNAARITEIIETKYVLGGLKEYCNKQFQYGLLHSSESSSATSPESVGYLRIHSFAQCSDNLDFTYQLNVLERSLDEIFAQASHWAGLIIDVRINGGGSDVFGVSIASRLASKEYLAYSKVTYGGIYNPQNRTAPQPILVHVSPRRSYHGPVILLISPDSNSAAETFAMALLGREPHAIRIGANTQGIFSDVLIRHLPNGWTFGLPNEIYLTRDGKSFDGVGVPPDIGVPIFSAEDLAKGRDSALDKALELLTPKAR